MVPPVADFFVPPFWLLLACLAVVAVISYAEDRYSLNFSPTEMEPDHWWEWPVAMTRGAAGLGAVILLIVLIGGPNDDQESATELRPLPKAAQDQFNEHRYGDYASP